MKDFKFTYSDKMNVKNFLEDAKKCENEVWFETLDGDQLSLKSTLCQFILLSLSEHPEALEDAVVRGTGEHDYEILVKYKAV